MPGALPVNLLPMWLLMPTNPANRDRSWSSRAATSSDDNPTVSGRGPGFSLPSGSMGTCTISSWPLVRALWV